MNFIKRNQGYLMIAMLYAMLWIGELHEKDTNLPTIYACGGVIILEIVLIIATEIKHSDKQKYIKEVKKTMSGSKGVYRAVIEQLHKNVIERVPDITVTELHRLYDELEDKGVNVITPYGIKCNAKCEREVDILVCFAGYNILYLIEVAEYQ